jgi:hypothetical protein
MSHGKGPEGSALVGAVTLTLIMSITALGFVQISASGVNHEQAALENEKAFQAAESGLLLGARWLMMQANWPTIGNNQPIVQDVSINDINVDVNYSAGANNTVLITSTASSARLHYTKRLTWVMVFNPGGPIFFTFSQWAESNIPL